MKFLLDDGEIEVSVRELVIAGWTGRDREAQQAHIRELAELGVAPPLSTPMYYRASKELLTQNPIVDILGDRSSGEVEAFLLTWNGQILLGVGSDHTDRKLEAQDVTLSKQQCPKPVSARLWRYQEVARHWDELILRSSIESSSGIEEFQDLRIYQESNISALLPPESILAGLGRLFATDDTYTMDQLPDGLLIFLGTIPVKGGFVFTSDNFRVELHVPIKNRSIEHRYRARNILVHNAEGQYA